MLRSGVESEEWGVVRDSRMNVGRMGEMVGRSRKEGGGRN